MSFNTTHAQKSQRSRWLFYWIERASLQSLARGLHAWALLAVLDLVAEWAGWVALVVFEVCAAGFASLVRAHWLLAVHADHAQLLLAHSLVLAVAYVQRLFNADYPVEQEASGGFGHL